MEIQSVVRTVALILLAQVGASWPWPLHAATPPGAATAAMAGALDAAVESQKSVEQATQRRAAQLREMDELEQRAVWLDYQLRQYGTYIAAREAVLAGLHRQEREGERMRMLLEPTLDATCADLAADVAAGPRFLHEERRARVEALRAVLKDYDAPLGEKLRRVLETLFIEAQYGTELSATDAVIAVADADPPPRETLPEPQPGNTTGDTEACQGLLAGRMLRVGRMAAYFLSRDKSRAYQLDTKGIWRPVDDSEALRTATALDMFDRRMLPGLVLLPGVPAP